MFLGWNANDSYISEAKFSILWSIACQLLNINSDIDESEAFQEAEITYFQEKSYETETFQKNELLLLCNLHHMCLQMVVDEQSATYSSVNCDKNSCCNVGCGKSCSIW